MNSLDADALETQKSFEARENRFSFFRDCDPQLRGSKSRRTKERFTSKLVRFSSPTHFTVNFSDLFGWLLRVASPSFGFFFFFLRGFVYVLAESLLTLPIEGLFTVIWSKKKSFSRS